MGLRDGIFPGWGREGVEFFIFQTPVLIAKLVCYTLAFPFYWMRYRNATVADTDVFNLCTNSSLVLFVSKTNMGYVYKSDPSRTPGFPPLEVHFTRNGQRIGTSPSNEEALSLMQNILMTWVHTCMHLAAEGCAQEIRERGVIELEASSKFVFSLHDGLVRGPFSPASNISPFYCLGNSSAGKVLSGVSTHPVPHHSTGVPELPYYRFLMGMRKLVGELVDYYELNVGKEGLFLLLAHGVDHISTFEQLKGLPFVSVDNSGSLHSRWQFYCFTYMWTQYWDNPLSSQLLKNRREGVFYKSLYEGLIAIDEGFANKVVISCCF